MILASRFACAVRVGEAKLCRRVRDASSGVGAAAGKSSSILCCTCAESKASRALVIYRLVYFPRESWFGLGVTLSIGGESALVLPFAWVLCFCLA